eukprot:600482-Pleurochrysis_carterae.AAC.1
MHRISRRPAPFSAPAVKTLPSAHPRLSTFPVCAPSPSPSLSLLPQSVSLSIQLSRSPSFPPIPLCSYPRSRSRSHSRFPFPFLPSLSPLLLSPSPALSLLSPPRQQRQTCMASFSLSMRVATVPFTCAE